MGQTPVVKDSGGRFGYKLISAVSARGDMHFDVLEESMNAEKVINFLGKLRQDAGCPVFVIADKARYHHSKKVQAYLETKLGEIMIAFLSAYSPELNPDEQVWNQNADLIPHLVTGICLYPSGIIQPKAITLPIQDFQLIAGAIAKNKNNPAKGSCTSCSESISDSTLMDFRISVYPVARYT